MTSKPTIFLEGHGLPNKQDEVEAERERLAELETMRRGDTEPAPNLILSPWEDKPLTLEEEGLLDGLPEEEQEVARNAPPEERAAILEHIRERRTMISPPGSFPWLNEFQERKRLAYLIADPFFTNEAALLDWVYIYQIPYRKVTAPGTRILLPDITKERYSKDGPRGIITDAGPLALQFLWTNGMDLGHTVTFARHAPWQVTMATVRGKPEVALVMRAGDLIASEEVAQARARRQLKYVMGKDGTVSVWQPEAMTKPYFLESSDEAM